MKNYIALTVMLVSFHYISMAQDTTSKYVQEKYGHTLNVGIGVGYYGYVGQNMPVLHANYEFDLIDNLTLAPFVTFYAYGANYTYKGQEYYYREMVIPVGVKCSYYFDKLFKASPKWDFYGAGSLGYAVVKSSWPDGFTGDRKDHPRANPVYVDLHAGVEYHINKKIGILLDLSTGVSTLSIAVHH